jgi:hypothetical protein
MTPLGMRLGDDIAKELDKTGVVIFRVGDNGQPYALFKLEDEVGAVASLSEDSNLYFVTTAKSSSKK